jgi:hypothetical protein
MLLIFAIGIVPLLSSYAHKYELRDNMCRMKDTYTSNTLCLISTTRDFKESKDLSPDRVNLQLTKSTLSALASLSEVKSLPSLETIEELFERESIPIGFISPLLKLSEFKALEFVLSYSTKDQLIKHIDRHMSDILEFVRTISILFPSTWIIVRFCNYRSDIEIHSISGYATSLTTRRDVDHFRSEIDALRFRRPRYPHLIIKFEIGKAIFYFIDTMLLENHYQKIKSVGRLFDERVDPSKSPVTFIHFVRFDNDLCIPRWILELQYVCPFL